MSEDDKRWHEDQRRNGWRLPQPAVWPLRWPVVRHIRAAVLGWRVDRHNQAWAGVGLVPRGYDEWVLYAIARGWC